MGRVNNSTSIFEQRRRIRQERTYSIWPRMSSNDEITSSNGGEMITPVPMNRMKRKIKIMTIPAATRSAKDDYNQSYVQKIINMLEILGFIGVVPLQAFGQPGDVGTIFWAEQRIGKPYTVRAARKDVFEVTHFRDAIWMWI
ncbi:5928_t:CDS:2 [Diversispora eburnea]|uniref:5928_t:CDS:1 n=1 Tax=Diversispora eburnea TaxID=1213867 RepID=A0A9N8W6M1_9GLOM|nr:5928_t:CDS:2 [Diversispora eburnea]